GLPAEHELLEDDTEAAELAWPRFFARVESDPAARQDFLDSVALHGRSQTLKALTNALAKRVEFRLADETGVVDAGVQPVAELFPELGGEGDPVDTLMRRQREALL
ncbi:MAG TPA: hypothetical protein DCM06_10065, partial [Comamonadaceae bacterium]|nr:hypothetical protein [Comamonadaceae bacterium]